MRKYNIQGLNDRIKELRISKNYKQADIAGLLDISISNYQSYEYGKLLPSAETLLNLCRVYDVSADYLIGLIDEKVSYRRDSTAQI